MLRTCENCPKAGEFLIELPRRKVCLCGACASATIDAGQAEGQSLVIEALPDPIEPVARWREGKRHREVARRARRDNRRTAMAVWGVRPR